MAAPGSMKTEIRMRLVVANPVPGVAHSLQDKKSKPVDPRTSAAGESLAFDFPIRIAPGPKFYEVAARRQWPVVTIVLFALNFIFFGLELYAGGADSTPLGSASAANGGGDLLDAAD